MALTLSGTKFAFLCESFKLLSRKTYYACDSRISLRSGIIRLTKVEMVEAVALWHSCNPIIIINNSREVRGSETGWYERMGTMDNTSSLLSCKLHEADKATSKKKKVKEMGDWHEDSSQWAVYQFREQRQPRQSGIAEWASASAYGVFDSHDCHHKEEDLRLTNNVDGSGCFASKIQNCVLFHTFACIHTALPLNPDSVP